MTIPEKNAEMTDGRRDKQTNRQTVGQTDNDDFIGSSVGQGSNIYITNPVYEIQKQMQLQSTNNTLSD